MNVNMLKGVIRGQGMTQLDVAEKVGINLSTFNAKLNQRGWAEFSLSELRALKVILGLDADMIDEIFFR